MKQVRASKLDKAIRELEALLDSFDSEDREEMKARADVLTSAILDSGLIERSPDDYLLGLDYVVKSMRMKSSKMIEDVESFYFALSSYQDDDNMEDAETALENFGPVLLEDLKQAKKKWSKQQR